MGTETVGSVSTTVYKGKVIVSKGDKLYIHCAIAGKVDGSKIKFTKHEAEPGETITNPLVITKGKTVTISRCFPQYSCMDEGFTPCWYNHLPPERLLDDSPL